MVTIRDIAKECGVSIATVSNVLNGKNKAGADTERRIRDAVERLGYKPNNAAKSLRSRKTGLVGIVVEDMAQFTVPPIVEGIMRRLEEYGYGTGIKNLRLYNRWSDGWFKDETVVRGVLEPALDEFKAMMLDGIIYVAVHARETSLIPEELFIPTVMAYALEHNPEVPSVIPDDERGAYEAVGCLIRNGHRKIGILGGKQDNFHTQMRIKGAKKALEEAGIDFDPRFLRYSGWQKENAYEDIDRLLDEGITAVFCMADRLAGGVYQRLNEYGKIIGKDLSVVGFDDQILARYMYPELTTVALPLHSIGEKAADILIEGISAGGYEEMEGGIYRMDCTLIERNSVGRV